ncbi:hypothetical protein [Pseudolactococcus reticulitermitis]|uniref:WxL domain-containing protein n=1 Tax=Pseudolactococcus reticulitermitis TaxID=2025039 RepID=A0A224X922_9LACT|nr:hypothetical protein [Lactococcus reticulitermitis]GAX46502.1 hypothetical protein RsY01_81 [Lactococcus reticulitermitis]
MKKILATLLISTAVFAGAQAVSADQTIDGQSAGDITVNGTLGADNTDPGSSIPETDPAWINVTIPTNTIFYNKTNDATIKAPTYTIVNHSGRPVKVTAASFTADANNGALPTDFDLNLKVTGTTANPATTPSTELIKDGSVTAAPSELITLANSANQFKASDTVATAVDNQATFTYGGTATSTTPLKLSYTLGLKFDSVAF